MKNKIPQTLEECLYFLDHFISEKDKNKLKNLSENEFLQETHLGLGMNIRNEWLRAKNSPLTAYFLQKGVRHLDDMSFLILTIFHRKISNQPFDLEEIIAEISAENPTENLFSIKQRLSTLPTILPIKEEVAVIQSLEKIKINEIKENASLFMDILSQIEASHIQNIFEKEAYWTEYLYFAQWLRTLKTSLSTHAKLLENTAQTMESAFL